MFGRMRQFSAFISEPSFIHLIYSSYSAKHLHQALQHWHLILFLIGRQEVSTNSTQDYFTAEMNMPSPTLIEHLTQLIRASPMTPSNPIFFTDRPLNDQEASFFALNSSTPLLMPASPQPYVPPRPSSVISNHFTSPANSEAPYDQIITLLRTLEKLLHIDCDLRERQTAYNKKRQHKVFSQLRRKTRAICQIMRTKEAALTDGQLAQLAHSVCLMRMKESAVHAQSTLGELSRVTSRLHGERHESGTRASQAVAEHSALQGEIRYRVTNSASPTQGIRLFIMPI
jgi:hypothetical protein